MTIDTEKEREWLEALRGNGNAVSTLGYVWERLTAAIDALDAQAAEIERLRRALRDISQQITPDEAKRAGIEGNFEYAYGALVCIARAALAERKP